MLKTMKIVLIGYGKMGQVIEKIAQARGHQIVMTIDAGQEERFASQAFLNADVAIEFTQPQAAYNNCLRCIEAGIPVVSGTTGWQEQMPELRERCLKGEGTLFWASNFSVGVNLFFALNKRLAELMNGQPDYRCTLSETHHIHKLDAPSGTAITLAEAVVAATDRLQGWQLQEGEEPLPEDILPIRSFREGEVPGTHQLSYQSNCDSITICHEAYGREGFATGAVLAAEYAATHSGFLSMSDLLKL